MTTTPVLDVRDLVVRYGGSVAVDGVTFDLKRGETIGLVGESGCGKSTLGKTIVRLHRPSSGSIRIAGSDIANLGQRDLTPYRRNLQMVFQDPAGSLNPRNTIATSLERPLIAHGLGDRAARRRRLLDVMDKIGLPSKALSMYPHEFSGGQKQRIGIARALVLGPEVIIFDEPVSALDLSIQAQILNLLIDLKRDFQLSYLFISHDLSVVRYVSDRIFVMYKGRIVETGSHQTIWASPRHPYTQALLSASSARHNAVRTAIRPVERATGSDGGCRFADRCPIAAARCRRDDPLLRPVDTDHLVACHFPSSLATSRDTQ